MAYFHFEITIAAADETAASEAAAGTAFLVLSSKQCGQHSVGVMRSQITTGEPSLDVDHDESNHNNLKCFMCSSIGDEEQQCMNNRILSSRSNLYMPSLSVRV